jgi:hypothetical protein
MLHLSDTLTLPRNFFAHLSTFTYSSSFLFVPTVWLAPLAGFGDETPSFSLWLLLINNPRSILSSIPRVYNFETDWFLSLNYSPRLFDLITHRSREPRAMEDLDTLTYHEPIHRLP